MSKTHRIMITMPEEIERQVTDIQRWLSIHNGIPIAHFSRAGAIRLAIQSLHKSLEVAGREEDLGPDLFDDPGDMIV